MIDHESMVPMYEQLAALLGNEIVSGRYRAGDRIPSEQSIAEQYGLSRVTVRHALAILGERGFLVSRQGKGTFVSESPVLTDEKLKSASFTYSRLRDKRIPDTEILYAGLRKCGSELAGLSGMNGNDMIGAVRRLRFVDKVPAVLEYDYFPGSISDVVTMDLQNMSLIALLDDKYGLKAKIFENRFRIIEADRDTAALMQVETGAPLLGVFETVMTEDGSVIYYNDQIIRPEIYEYRLRYSFE